MRIMKDPTSSKLIDSIKKNSFCAYYRARNVFFDAGQVKIKSNLNSSTFCSPFLQVFSEFISTLIFTFFSYHKITVLISNNLFMKLKLVGSKIKNSYTKNV